MKQKNGFRTTIGGQALIEGIMMRGPKKTSVVVRTPDGFETKVENTSSPKQKYPVLGLPVIRGVVNFALSMKIGMSSLNYSASFFPEDENAAPSRFDRWLEEHFESKAVEKVMVAVASVFAAVIAVGLFILLPLFLGSLLEPLVGTGFLRHLIETVTRLALLIGYMAGISQLKDIKRVYSYHGAEHKTIACYEAGDELTVENVRKHTRKHPRCGTSFILTVVIISLFVFFISQSFFSMFMEVNLIFRLLLRLALLPFVVAISYEINQCVGKNDNALTYILRAPGLWLQSLTTREPDDSMIEVGIEALRLVIPETPGEDEWGGK